MMAKIVRLLVIVAMLGLSLSAARGQDTTTGISGNFTEDEAERLAAQLRAGALPLPLRVKSVETVEAISGEQVIGQ